MVLDGEDRRAVDADAFEAAVEQRAVSLDNAFGQAFSLDDKTVVLAGDFNLAGLEVLDRMVGAPVAVMHFDGAAAQGTGQHLMAETDAEDRLSGLDQPLDHRHGIFAGCGWIAGTVGEEDAVGLVGQNIGGA